jgi:hypothetical protein
LLEGSRFKTDDLGLPDDKEQYYMLLIKGSDTVEARIFNDKMEQEKSMIINMPFIPFIDLSMSDSALKETATYQIALMNIESSDISYAIRSNFPFYTEQSQPSPQDFMRPPATKSTEEGEATPAGEAKRRTAVVGGMQGRTYGKDMDRPGFIAPPSAPLEVSMRKQEEMKKGIRQLLQLSISGISPSRESLDARRIDQEGLESGLAGFALVLEHGERQIARIWERYQGVKNDYVITYPRNFSLKSDEQRVKDAKEKVSIARKVPSNTLRREIFKEVAEILLDGKVSPSVIASIKSEINDSKATVGDIEEIISLIENGLIDDTTAASLVGVKDAEKVVKAAREDHERRLERIAVSQTKGIAADKDAAATGGEKSKRTGDE